jgi:hypothetical protein
VGVSGRGEVTGRRGFVDPEAFPAGVALSGQGAVFDVIDQLGLDVAGVAGVLTRQRGAERAGLGSQLVEMLEQRAGGGSCPSGADSTHKFRAVALPREPAADDDFDAVARRV